MRLYQRIDRELREAVQETPKVTYCCSNCSAVYGDGPQTNPKKMERGFCSLCWDWFLAGQRLHWQELRLRERKEGTP